jgi:hypothetical protein
MRVSTKLTAGFVLVSVTDRGPGVPDADKERIFERFYRGDGGTGPARGSTPALAALAAAVLLAGGCATTPEFHRHYEEGRFAEAVEAFRADTTLAGEERAIFRAGVARLLLARGREEERAAGELFRRLLERNPRTSYAPQARLFLRQIERREELRRELARARREAEVLRGRVEWMRGRLTKARGREDSLSARLSDLTTRLRQQEEDCAQLREELERLKRIDLEPQP